MTQYHSHTWTRQPTTFTRGVQNHPNPNPNPNYPNYPKIRISENSDIRISEIRII
ncbi:hypothetical protein HanOQP8_Chr04g0129101 [Helianthus annuus]|nr:hypothetical protein HanHA89_Chr04g0128611 [Helianthus annuus]KAJ0759654.1 hypothetical protein HanOQP8_Chr04g0129101 [Helianthus annuus]KAJ0823852.1 hypothetical protein HanLR1_Chr00c0168g0724541 [Helianthus annuus]